MKDSTASRGSKNELQIKLYFCLRGLNKKRVVGYAITTRGPEYFFILGWLNIMLGNVPSYFRKACIVVCNRSKKDTPRYKAKM